MAGDRATFGCWTGAWPPIGSGEEAALCREMLEHAVEVAHRLCGSRLAHVADDVAANAVWSVMTVLRCRPEQVRDQPAYLARAVRNAFLNDVRAAARRRELAARIPRHDHYSDPVEERLAEQSEISSIFHRVRARRPRMKDGDLVLEALRLLDAGFNQTEVAERLLISRENLVKKLKDYGDAARQLRLEEARGA